MFSSTPAGPERRPRVAGGCASRPTVRELVAAGVKIAATFTTIAVLWSLWSSPSLAAWLEMLARGFQGI